MDYSFMVLVERFFLIFLTPSWCSIEPVLFLSRVLDDPVWCICYRLICYRLASFQQLSYLLWSSCSPLKIAAVYGMLFPICWLPWPALWPTPWLSWPTPWPSPWPTPRPIPWLNPRPTTCLTTWPTPWPSWPTPSWVTYDGSIQLSPCKFPGLHCQKLCLKQ